MPLFKNSTGKIMHVPSDPRIGHGISLGDHTERRINGPFDWQDTEHDRRLMRIEAAIVVISFVGLLALIFFL